MKQLFFIIFIFGAILSNAQNSELQKIYNQIDKIIEDERNYYHKQIKNNAQQIEQIKWYGNIYKPVYDYGKLVRQPLNRKYEKQVLKYIEKHQFDQMINVRETVYDLIYSVGFYSNNLTI